MRALRSLLLAAAVACGACDSILGLGNDPDRISWGSSFGMCIGYCRQELQVTASEIRLTKSSWDGAHYPTVVSTRANTAAAWDSLKSALGGSGFMGLAEVYGCPDCADGGAEWVEVSSPQKRVTFEYGQAPGGLGSAVAQLRRMRDRFSD